MKQSTACALYLGRLGNVAFATASLSGAYAAQYGEITSPKPRIGREPQRPLIRATVGETRRSESVGRDMMIGLLRRVLASGACLLACAFAKADVGDVVAVIMPDPPAAGSYCSIGLAFDGTSLYFNRCNDPLIYEISPADGSMISSFDPMTAENPNAMAFDSKRNGIWFGTQACGATGMPIYFWDFDDDSVTSVFTIPYGLINPATGSPFLRFCFNDGLAYNENDPGTDADDEIWFSDDVTRELGLFRPDGTLVAGFDATTIDPSLINGSGLAVGGPNLYMGNNGGGDVFRAAIPAFLFVDAFASGDDRQEDMECDPITFAPTEVMWVRTTPQGGAFPDVITAYEIEPGTCGLGGMIANPPHFDPPTPCNEHLAAVVGEHIDFDVIARSVHGGSGEQVTLTALGVPAGSSFTPPLPLTGQPATTTFSWTPTIGEVGSQPIRIVATDDRGQATDCLVSVRVTPQSCEVGTSYCSVNPNSTGLPGHVRARGSAAGGPGGAMTLIAEDVPDQPGIFFFGPNRILVPFGNGFLCAGPPTRVLPPVLASGGSAKKSIQTDPFTPGSSFYFQYWFRDPAAGGAFFNTTDGLCIAFDGSGCDHVGIDAATPSSVGCGGSLAIGGAGLGTDARGLAATLEDDDGDVVFLETTGAGATSGTLVAGTVPQRMDREGRLVVRVGDGRSTGALSVIHPSIELVGEAYAFVDESADDPLDVLQTPVTVEDGAGTDGGCGGGLCDRFYYGEIGDSGQLEITMEGEGPAAAGSTVRFRMGAITQDGDYYFLVDFTFRGLVDLDTCEVAFRVCEVLQTTISDLHGLFITCVPVQLGPDCSASPDMRLLIRGPLASDFIAGRGAVEICD